MNYNKNDYPYSPYYPYPSQYPPWYNPSYYPPYYYGYENPVVPSPFHQQVSYKVEEEIQYENQPQLHQKEKSDLKSTPVVKIEQREPICKEQGDKVLQSKQILEQMLEQYKAKSYQFQQLYSSLPQETNQHLSKLYKKFYSKIIAFNKTKEEMVKYIIRKTQRLYKKKFACKKDSRFIKFGKFKSMNAEYLQNLFQDTKFSQCFEEICLSFREDFKIDNQDKIQNILKYFRNINDQATVEKGIQHLDDKNTMPWPLYWQKKLYSNLIFIYKTYGNFKTEIQNFLENEMKMI